MANIKKSGRPRIPRNGADQHRAWLGLVQTDGPFLSVPVLKKVWPDGMPSLGQNDVVVELRQQRAKFEKAWDVWHKDELASGARSLQGSFAALRREREVWADIVLRRVFDWGNAYDTSHAEGSVCERLAVFSPDKRVRMVPDGVLLFKGRPCALVLVVGPQEATLECNYPNDGWSASAIDRMAALLRNTSGDDVCSIGIVTDGRWWALVSAPQGGPTAWGMVDSLTWVEEPSVRDAFARLMDIRLLRAGGGIGGQTLPQMFHDSIAQAEEVTESLGQQVRAAVELLVAAFGESSRRAREAGLPDPLPGDANEVYEAAVCTMMRVVFLLFAQERGLLPQGALFTRGYGMLGVLDELDERSRIEGEEAMDGTSLAWHRLLAASRVIYEGATFEDMRSPAYGGSVFDPARHPFLTQTGATGELGVVVSDRVMYHVLKSVQEIMVGGDRRRLSFREIDVEQIGYIYEGLLGFTCRRATECVLGLKGKGSDEPEVTLAELEQIWGKVSGDPAKVASGIVDYLKKEDLLASGDIPSKTTYEKLLKVPAADDLELKLAQAAHGESLRERLRPWMPIVRIDMRGKPVVFEPGDLYVTATSSRKDAGAHYTPRSLAEDVVLHALQPLVYNPGPYQTNDEAQWRRISSSQILNLKVADIACGSGAFLVAASRYLAGELAEAWVAEGEFCDIGPDERHRMALRRVVANCIYGVDINEMAVEMCKLSLWLVSLDSKKPFSFVDNKILVGNSLLGVTDLKQIENLNLDGKSRTGNLFYLDDGGRMFARSRDFDEIMREARSLRARLAEDISENDPMRGAKHKARLMAEYDEKVGALREVADGLIAAGLNVGGKPGKKLGEELDKLSKAVARAFPGDASKANHTMLAELTDKGLTPMVKTDYEHWKCLHWPIEFPEVFEQGGFDAVIGNPPFLGGQKLTGAFGENVRDWFVNVLACGKSGSADLCAYFFLIAFALVRGDGTIGLLATNSIAQGVTRCVGLDQLDRKGLSIARSIRSKRWPVSSASLEFAAIWGIKGLLGKSADKVCDGIVTAKISTLLEPQGREDGTPFSLSENLGIAFQGCTVVGDGFLLEPKEAKEWIDLDETNEQVLFPYLNGIDLNSRFDCSASRWTIDFNARSEEEARQYRIPFERVLFKVRPERQKNNQKAYRDVWWQYAARRDSMRKAISNHVEVIVIVQTSRTLMPARVRNNQVFSNALTVFALDSYSQQAILSSSIHQQWVVRYGSGMKDDARYIPTDVFETFPRPADTPELDAIGRTLDIERREIMLRRQLGLTKLYNLVNDPDLSSKVDPDVARLRQIHEELDHVVMSAYGWDDVPLNHGFYEYRKMTRWTVCPEARVEILDRLLEENHHRAALEAKGGTG